MADSQSQDILRQLQNFEIDAGITVPVGSVTAAREPGSVMARALTEVARHAGVAAALERFPGDPAPQ
ncbi:hypothetical protein OG497_36030 [Streptomyces sp. NBC_01242]|uniref:hypothetical protein n=1 Tax=Streptomyces sp. NBC_01242 TaxID=2903795 RepID=UPI00225695A6|nr:hypothetical protein [Streptomyces sp. NBC_01242]MCX4799308.1 hypothetical protein [Streptomyces sp. NBC_01242]